VGKYVVDVALVVDAKDIPKGDIKVSSRLMLELGVGS